MRTPSLCLLAAALLGLALAPAGAGAAPRPASEPAPFKLVVHPDVPVQALSRAQAAAYFLKRATRFGDVPARPVDQPVKSDVRLAFSDAVLRRTPDAVAAYWEGRVFAGRDTPPVQKASDAEVVAYVAATEGAIGYVAVDAPTRGVRVVPLLD